MFFACSKNDKQKIYPQPTTTMRNVSQDIDFRQEKTEIIDTTKNDDIPRYMLTNQPITENPIGVSTTNQPQTSTNTTRPTTITTHQLQAGDYTAQLLSAKSRAQIEVIKRKLDNENYRTEIQEAIVNGETVFRLRLSDGYTKASAEQLAKEIQAKFSADIKGYWITTK